MTQGDGNDPISSDAGAPDSPFLLEEMSKARVVVVLAAGVSVQPEILGHAQGHTQSIPQLGTALNIRTAVDITMKTEDQQGADCEGVGVAEDVVVSKEGIETDADGRQHFSGYVAIQRGDSAHGVEQKRRRLGEMEKLALGDNGPEIANLLKVRVDKLLGDVSSKSAPDRVRDLWTWLVAIVGRGYGLISLTRAIELDDSIAGCPYLKGLRVLEIMRFDGTARYKGSAVDDVGERRGAQDSCVWRRLASVMTRGRTRRRMGRWQPIESIIHPCA